MVVTYHKNCNVSHGTLVHAPSEEYQVESNSCFLRDQRSNVTEDYFSFNVQTVSKSVADSWSLALQVCNMTEERLSREGYCSVTKD